MRFGLKPELKIAFSLALGSHLVASLLAGKAPIDYLISFVISLLVFCMVWSKILDFIKAKAKGTGFQQAYKKYEEGVFRLTVAEAKEQAEPLLRNSEKFRCVELPLSADDNRLVVLGPLMQEFFSRYQTVQTVRGEAVLNRDKIQRSNLNKRFLTIGTDTDFTELAIKRGQDYIYEIDGFEQSESDFEGYPSIYHWILVMNWTLYPEDFKE